MFVVIEDLALEEEIKAAYTKDTGTQRAINNATNMF